LADAATGTVSAAAMPSDVISHDAIGAVPCAAS
jgi:hypothetical protein